MSRSHFALAIEQGILSISGLFDHSFCFLLYLLDSYPSQGKKKKKAEEIYKNIIQEYSF